MENTTPHSAPPNAAADAPLVAFNIDLTAHEARRLGAVLDAMPDWDPMAVLTAENQAYALLYSGLSPEQRILYDLLREEGVLDDRS